MNRKALYSALEWVRSHFDFSDGTKMDEKYYNGLVERGLAADAPV